MPGIKICLPQVQIEKNRTMVQELLGQTSVPTRKQKCNVDSPDEGASIRE
jgi:hypothetical protein